MKKSLYIIGGGSAGLFLAAMLDAEKFDIHLFERNRAAGRKFLVAGDGGLNLTHAEDPDKFIERYTPAGFLRKAFTEFNNRHFVEWLSSIGVETFTGSSSRVFPEKKWKPVQVLEMIIRQIEKRNVKIHYGHKWIGLSQIELVFEHAGRPLIVKRPEISVFALGGASWPVTGSKGEWLDEFRKQGIHVEDFEASNCTFLVEWPPAFAATQAGKVLKNISVSCGGITITGEVTITADGLEGSGIYPLSPMVRNEIRAKGKALLSIDLKPALTKAQIIDKLKKTGTRNSFSNEVKKVLNLTNTQLQLVKNAVSKAAFTEPESLADAIKSLALTVSATGPVEDAISTVGGISLDEVDENFAIKKLPGVYAIGEMLDYDAPTGGYLLQSSFTMAAYLTKFLNNKG